MKITPTKIFVGFSLAGLAYLAYQWARKAFADFAYKIVGYGVPQFNSTTWQLTLPVHLQFNNPTPLALNVDEVLIDVYLVKGIEHSLIGFVSEKIVSLPPGQTERVIIARLNLGTLASGIIDAFEDIVRSKRITLRTVVNITYKGVELPTQSSTDTLSL